MKFLKKLEFGIRQSVELYIPAISFVVMFCLFCYQILVRYVISKFTNLVVPWTTEVVQGPFRCAGGRAASILPLCHGFSSPTYCR